MSFVFHDFATGAAHCSIKFVDTSVRHRHFVVLVYVGLLLWVYAIDGWSSWIHFLLGWLILWSESVGALESKVFLVLIDIVSFKSMVSLFTMWVDHHWLVLSMEIRCAMEWVVQVLDGGGDLWSWADRVSMHRLLLRLTKRGKLRADTSREGLFSLIEVWSLFTRHPEDRLVLLCRPSRRFGYPSTAIVWLCRSATVGGLSWQSCYFCPLWLLEWQHLLVVGRTLHLTRISLLMSHRPWIALSCVHYQTTILSSIVAIFCYCW